MEQKNIILIKRIVACMGCILGVVSVCVGLFSSAWNSLIGSTVTKTYYGGDAYTGIQQAAADTANNVADVTWNQSKILFGMQFMVVVAGFVIIFAFLIILLNTFEIERKNALYSEGGKAVDVRTTQIRVDSEVTDTAVNFAPNSDIKVQDSNQQFLSNNVDGTA